jgi:hypothetical protein
MFLFHATLLYAGTPHELSSELLEVLCILENSKPPEHRWRYRKPETGRELIDARMGIVYHAGATASASTDQEQERWCHVAEIFRVLAQDPATYAYFEKECTKQQQRLQWSATPVKAAGILYDALRKHLCSWKGGIGKTPWISDAAFNAATLALKLKGQYVTISEHDNSGVRPASPVPKEQPDRDAEADKCRAAFDARIKKFAASARTSTAATGTRSRACGSRRRRTARRRSTSLASSAARRGTRRGAAEQ